MANVLIDLVVRESEKHKIALPTLSIEPGRSIIGQSTVTLYEVGTIKPIGKNDLEAKVEGDTEKPKLKRKIVQF
jgi:diaminopimelate decarboxylase